MTATTLDLIDRKIVSALMQDATQPIGRIADQVGLSQTPCWKRIQKLEAAGVLTGRVAIADPAKLGLGLTVFAGGCRNIPRGCRKHDCHSAATVRNGVTRQI